MIRATTQAAPPASASPHPPHPVEVQPNPAAIAKPPKPRSDCIRNIKTEWLWVRVLVPALQFGPHYAGNQFRGGRE